jgi:hypothetical protein
MLINVMELKEGISVNAWESIFLQSPVNSGYYGEDELPQQNWQWPKETWFQGRLDYIRGQEPLFNRKSHRGTILRANPASVVGGSRSC